MRERIVSYRKCKVLRSRTWKRSHRNLSLPCLTQPSLLRNLLQISSSFASRVHVSERHPNPERDYHGGREDERQQNNHQLVVLLFWGRCNSRWRFNRLWCISHPSSGLDATG